MDVGALVAVAERKIVMEDMKAQKVKFLSVKELAAMLPVSQSLLYDRIAKNKIPCLRIGRRILIPMGYIQEKFKLTR